MHEKRQYNYENFSKLIVFVYTLFVLQREFDENWKKKHKCMLTIELINDIMYAMKNRSATINNEILTKAHKKTMK